MKSLELIYIGMHMKKVKKRGRGNGEGKKLTILDERKVIERMINLRPDDYGEKPFWTKESVMVLIEKELNIQIAITSVNDYLKRWGLINNKIISMNKKFQRTQNLRIWLSRVESKIRKDARTKNIQIVWVESYSIVRFSEALTQKSWEYKKWNIKCYQMKIVAPFGKKAFILTRTRYNGFEFINLLKNLIQDVDKKTYLILKIKKISPVKPVNEWLDKNRDKIEVHYAPVR